MARILLQHNITLEGRMHRTLSGCRSSTASRSTRTEEEVIANCSAAAGVEAPAGRLERRSGCSRALLRPAGLLRATAPSAMMRCNLDGSTLQVPEIVRKLGAGLGFLIWMNLSATRL